MPTHAETPLSVPYKLLCSRSCLPSWPWGSIQTSAGGQADPCLFSASSTRSQQAANLSWDGEMLNGEKVGLQIAGGACFFFLWGEIFNLKHTFYRAFSRSNMSSNSIQHLRSNLCTVPTFGVEITAMAVNSFGATCSNRRVIWLVAGLQGCSFAFAWPWTALTPVAAWSSIEELEE